MVAAAQVFCFPGGDTSCSTLPLTGGAASPSECCFTPGRGGRGGGSYSGTGSVECISCMTVIGMPIRDNASGAT